MIREARGFYEREGALTPAPMVRLGFGFGPDRVVATAAVVDTGSDLCVIPKEIVPWPLPESPVLPLLVEGVGGPPFPATATFPSITAGDIRIPYVATLVLAGADAILGRSFLNQCELRLSAERGTVLLRRAERARS